METVPCCADCGGQVHMLFSNKALSEMTLDELLQKDEMQSYLQWKRNHPGEHKHRMSRGVKEWRRGHRG